MKALKIISYLILSLLFLYIISGFFLLPYIAKKEIIKNLDEILITKTKIEKIYFNPLTLNLEINGFSLLDEKDQEILGLKNLFIDFRALKSIEKKHFHIKNILLEGIYLNIIEEEKGVFNLASLIKQTETKEEETKHKEVEKLIDFLVSKIVLKDTNIDFTSFTDKKKYNLHLKDINYTIYDFGTFKNSLSSNNLEFKLNENTDVKISGGLKIDPFIAYGKITISNLKIKELLDFDKSLFNFELNPEANINLALNYNIDTTNDFNLFLNSEIFEINDLKLKQNQKEIVRLNKLDLKYFSFDLNNQELNFKDLYLNDLYVNMILDKSGVNFTNLLKEKKYEKEIQHNTQENNVNNKPWKINFENTNINANFDFDDILNNAKLNIKDIKVKTSNINIVDDKINIKGANLLTLNTKYLDNKNKINISSSKTDLTHDDIFINGSKVEILNSSLKKDKITFEDEKLKIKITTNSLGLDLQKLSIFDEISFDLSNIKINNLVLEDKNNNISLSSKNSNLKINNFLLDKQNNISINKSELYDTNVNFFDSNSSFDIKTKKTNLKISNFNLKKDVITIGQILLKEPKIDILNIESKLKIEAKNINLDLNKLVSKENLFRIDRTNLNNPHLSIILPKNIQAKGEIEKNSIKKEEVDKKVENKKTTKLNLGPINIKNMILDFEDKNLPIPFKTTISKLTGAVSAVKNRANSTSNLEIKGVVDDYGVAKITGIVNPNDIKILTDINMKFQNISMKNFTPYTAKFIGRTIKDGKLELDLNYNISESNLKAKNSIIIKKLELGDKIESEDAVSLPLDLAITLLEDSSNTIDLNLPVSGNVDDPEFSIAAIVWKAFVNLITKAITAPFSLIGSLFNFSEDEINSVDFNLKESEITPIQQETLDKIAIILNSKKEFAISFSPSFDEKNEKEKIANQRALNIQKYLIEEKSIDKKQVVLEKDIKKSSSNIDLSLKEIKE
ncbi:hypothetical protein AN286_08215 [Aliarcobacter cryaerophilus ATCC 43158]|uniref:DUF748 domain-containing membrane protein n=2 Tax=Aliarcobacter cryaerophilus TaxID=28198 RepID=A0AAD0TTK2_9BACT|nr:DUF748 domain-containing protein [Aliarcobacter cryaerophilus]AYJ80151.1 DUF748 domain-containing membrane protein [Aliarcobacter cryaerophilus ATCC 43158]QCZ24372.1 hypothetical protein AN286_08215 [Aliarcobacter cryaerophilus ATCC 43158]